MKRKKNLCVLGCGTDQVPGIQKAIEFGYGVLGMDGNPQALGFELCDKKAVVDIKNPDEVEDIALQFNKSHGIDGCIAFGVEVGPSVGRVIDKLGLRGIGEKEAATLTDKFFRCQFLDDHRILQPRWSMVGKMLNFPVVIKPRDKCAAEGVMLIETGEELEGKKYDIAQEYVDGWEISTEVLFTPARILTVNADRNYDKKHKWKPYLIEDGCSLPSKLPDHMLEKINNIVMKIIRVMNLSFGILKLDLIIRNNLVYVIECVPRLGGGKLSSTMIPLHAGYDWWGNAIRTVMEHGFDIPSSLHQSYVAQRYVFPEKVTSHRDRITDFIETGSTLEEAINNAEEKVRLYEAYAH